MNARLAQPVLTRRAEIPAGAVFVHAGRPLKVVRVHGIDAAAPVIVEELASFGQAVLAGQYALWSVAGVAACMGLGR